MRNGGPRRGGHARQRRGETGEEVWREVRGREAPSWGVGGLRPGARPRFPSARVPESSRILPGARPRSTPESAQNPRSLSPIFSGARPGCPPEPARDPPGAGPCPGAPRAAQDKSLSHRLGYARLYRLGGAPIGGTHETRRRVPRSDPLPAAVPALRLAPGRRPRASALASPWCARSLPEPGLIWSRWRQAVGTAQPPQPACQYPAHNPPAARPRLHAHRARPLPLRDPLQIPGLRLPPTLVPA